MREFYYHYYSLFNYNFSEITFIFISLSLSQTRLGAARVFPNLWRWREEREVAFRVFSLEVRSPALIFGCEDCRSVIDISAEIQMSILAIFKQPHIGLHHTIHFIHRVTLSLSVSLSPYDSLSQVGKIEIKDKYSNDRIDCGVCWGEVRVWSFMTGQRVTLGARSLELEQELGLTHGRPAKCQERDTGLHCWGRGDSDGESWPGGVWVSEWVWVATFLSFTFHLHQRAELSLAQSWEL